MTISSLKNQAAFDQINKTGTKLYSPHLILVIKTSPQEATSFTLGIKANKKLGPAVVRNKIKRRIRHLMQMLMHEYSNVKANVSMIIVPKKNFENFNFANIYNDLNKLVKNQLTKLN